MFNFDMKPHDVALDAAISDVLVEMNGLNSDSEEYAAAADQLVKLMKLKKEITPTWRPSPDALVGAAGSILGILLILNFERAGVVTSKALTFVTKIVK
jgi:hypothetical protein